MEHGEYREDFLIDEDHPYSYDHTEPKSSAIFIFGGATVFLLILVTIGITFYYDSTRESLISSEVLTVESDQLKALRAMEDRDLHSYAFIDKNTGKVRLPIDRAMQLVAEESAQNRLKYATNAYAVKTPEQLAGQAPIVSQPGVAALKAAQDQGIGSSPHVQPAP